MAQNTGAGLKKKDWLLSVKLNVAVVIAIQQEKYTCIYFKRRREQNLFTHFTLVLIVFKDLEQIWNGKSNKVYKDKWKTG